MKKLKLFSAALILSVMGFSCNSDDDSSDDLSCDEATAAVAGAALAYSEATASNFVERCNDYKAALMDQKEACGDDDGTIQDMIQDLGDCTVIENPGSGVISLTVGGNMTFETNITVTNDATGRSIYAEDAGTTNWILIRVEDGEIGGSALTSFVLHLGTSDYGPLPVDEGGNFTSDITVNTQTDINGTFYGYVTSPTTGADLDVTSGIIDLDL